MMGTLDATTEAACQQEGHAAFTERGIALSDAGDVAGALEQFRLAVRQCPGAAQHRNVGVALMRLNEVAGAIEAFRLAVAADAGYADGYRLLAEALLAAGQADDAIEALQAGLRHAPHRSAALRHIASVLLRENRPAEAAVYLEQAVRCSPDPDSALLRELGLSRLQAGDAPAAVRELEAALAIDPRDVAAHACLAVAFDRLGEPERAVAQYEQALLLHRAAPRRWPDLLQRDVARIGLRYEETPVDLPANGPLLTVLVGCYGDFPQYSLRCFDSISNATQFAENCNLLIGLSACGPTTVAAAEDLMSRGLATGIVRSSRNLNKDPMMRLLLEQVRTPYLLWLDDDSHIPDPSWAERLCAWIRDEHPFDVAGQLVRYGPHRFKDSLYAGFIRKRPWWKTDRHLPADLREYVPFVLGGCFVARSDFLRRHDFPDRAMIKAMDDVALGELLLQKGGRLLSLPPDLLAMAKINDGERRGEDFALRQPG